MTEHLLMLLGEEGGGNVVVFDAQSGVRWWDVGHCTDRQGPDSALGIMVLLTLTEDTCSGMSRESRCQLCLCGFLVVEMTQSEVVSRHVGRSHRGVFFHVVFKS